MYYNAACLCATGPLEPTTSALVHHTLLPFKNVRVLLCLTIDQYGSQHRRGLAASPRFAGCLVQQFPRSPVAMTNRVLGHKSFTRNSAIERVLHISVTLARPPAGLISAL